MSDPCAGLVGRPRSICDGTSGLPEETRAAYVRSWVEQGMIDASALAIISEWQGPPPPIALAPRFTGNHVGGGEDDNPYPPTKRSLPCWAVGVVLREQKCDVCSYKHLVKEIRFCPFHGECFEGKGGFRAPAAIQPCRYCDNYNPF